MKRYNQVAKTEPARSSFAFTDEEVAEALTHYLLTVSNVDVPNGKQHVRVRDSSFQRGRTEEKPALAELFVTHES